MRTAKEMTDNVLQKYKERKAKRKKLILRSSAIALCGVIALGAGSIALLQSDITTKDLNGAVHMTHSSLMSKKRSYYKDVSMTEEAGIAYRKFAADVFSASYEGENALVSPLSLYLAIAMVTQGAEGETKAELYSLFNLNDEEAADTALYLYNRYSEEEAFKKIMNVANSIWIREKEDFSVKQDFLDVNSDFFGAEIYKSDFSYKAVDDINNWVKVRTGGKIKKVIEKIAEDVMMYLINTVNLEARWADAFDFYSSLDFTDSDGNVKKVDSMNRTMSGYYDSGNALAFSYALENGLAFMGILPNGSIDEYTFDSAEIEALFDGFKSGYYDEENDNLYGYEVHAALPKFSYSCEIDMKESLQNMGIEKPFDKWEADFSGICDETYRLWIENIAQRTYIDVNKDGVSAAAATVIEMPGKTSPGRPETIEEVNIILDRPFIYMIYDGNNNLPLFIGSVNCL